MFEIEDDNAEPSVLNTILFYCGDSLQGLPAMAAITMPIMTPLSVILGVKRQTACLAFHLGDGFTNMKEGIAFAIPSFKSHLKIILKYRSRQLPLHLFVLPELCHIQQR